MLLKINGINTQNSSLPKYLTITYSLKVICVYYICQQKEPESLEILKRFSFMGLAEELGEKRVP